MVVVVAALVTGIVAGLPLFTSEGIFEGVPFLTKAGQPGIINTLGKAFVDNRLMTLFILTFPAIGLAERFGLQQQSAALIRRISAATVGRLQIVYQLFRVLMGILGIRVNGHPAFVRPIVFPMSVGAAEATTGAKAADELPEEIVEEIKASNAASENYGNFYGQNLNPVQAGILLVATTLGGLGYAVSVWSLVLYTIPIVTLSVILGEIQFLMFDRRIQRKAAKES
jgi:uncharacterized membrane protein